MIRITNGDRTTELAWDGAPVSVSRLLERAGLHPDRPCGGQGRCGKCQVLARGDLSPAAPEERKHLTAAELDAGVRLACMARISGPDADIGLPREGQLLVETGLPLHRLTWEPWAAGLGVSVDTGTTTVAAYLWDLDGRRQQALYALYGREAVLPMGAGTCRRCASCTCPHAPCRFPEEQVVSMEAYGLLVSQVCQDCGAAYYHGPRTMTYVSCVFLRRGL